VGACGSLPNSRSTVGGAVSGFYAAWLVVAGGVECEFADEFPAVAFQDADREGRVFFQHAGEQITDVYVVRITISQIMHGEPTWTLSSDCGVIFRLTEGAAAVCKIGHHTDALDVFFADSVEALEIDYGFDEWDVANELGEDYESSHELILIE
jgi:hypothetical protein